MDNRRDISSGATQLDDLLARHREFWRRGPAQRPLLNIGIAPKAAGATAHLKLPLADGTFPAEGQELLPEMLAPERLHTETGGGPSLRPDRRGDFISPRVPYGVNWMEAVVGARIRVWPAANTIWSEATLCEDWHEHPASLATNKKWMDKLLEFVRFLVRNARGRYLVTLPLMRGPSDMAAALLGHEQLCFAMLEHPQSLESLLDFCTEVFIEMTGAQLELIPPFEGGYCNPYGIWAPGTTLRTQDDASAIYSAEHCRRFMLPCQERIGAAVGYSVLHLHSGSLHVARVYAESENITAIQMTLDSTPTAPRLREMLPTLAAIMERKPLIITGEVTEAEVALALSELSPRGLCISVQIAA